MARHDGRKCGADDLRHLHARRSAVHRRPARLSEKSDCARRGQRVRAQRRSRSRVLPLPDEERHGDHRNARCRELLRSQPRRSGRGRAARDRPRARSDGLSRRSGASRSRPRPARDRLPVRRRAHDRRQHHDLPLHRQERGDPKRASCDVHAQADLRHQRLRHAHAHVALLRRIEHLLRREGRLSAERALPELHRRRPPPLERLLRDHQSAGEFIQAARARLRSADGNLVVREEPQPARACARDARRRDAHRAAHARSVLQSVSRIGGDAAIGARRDREEDRSWSADQQEHLQDEPPRAASPADRRAAGQPDRGARRARER